jgi:FAD/FMN-containing dehydrogenase
MAEAVGKKWKAVIEFAPEARKNSLDLWPAPGGDLEIMKRIKTLFDPSNLLNRGRLYRLI